MPLAPSPFCAGARLLHTHTYPFMLVSLQTIKRTESKRGKETRSSFTL